MRRALLSALLALNIALAYGAPKNNAEVSEVEDKKAEVATKADKGDLGFIEHIQNDGAFVRICQGLECKVTTVKQVKAMDTTGVHSAEMVKAESNVAGSLETSVGMTDSSLKGLQQQQLLLDNLHRQMASMTSAFNKGQMLNENAKGQFASMMSKGISFSAPPSKGYAAPPSKGYAAPPSKGGSAAANMQLEAALCPMTMYELGKSQKLASEMKVMMDNANAMNAVLMAEKEKYKGAALAAEMARQKAQEQADFNAKYAAEQKNRADTVTAALAFKTAEAETLKQQKSDLESNLAVAQSLLNQERQNNMILTDNLKTCNEEKDAVTAERDAQTARAEAAEQELAETKEALEKETDARIECEETLKFTQNRLNRTEEDLAAERTAKEQTEEELMKTMTDLAACQRELRVTSEILNRTQDELQDKTQALARETAAREQLEQKLAATVQELRETEANLRDTRRTLEDEQNAHDKTKRDLAATQEELEATEEARKQLEEAKQQLEDELTETKNQLENMTAERDQLQATLDATDAALAKANEEKLQCLTSLGQEKAITQQLSSQLNDAMTMLQAEQKAREEMAATIMAVQKASEMIQEEVKKLQLENLQLQQQVMKLRSEQETALAMAAGCPPTYEKFGINCYKYVREKTPWKMAQEQCMKDSGNLVSIESKDEQIFLVDFLKRHGAAKSDAYAYTSGYKEFMKWKWLGALNNYVGATGPEYWYNDITKMKPNYDCMAMYLYDSAQAGKWVGLPCYNSAPFVCKYNLAPPGTPAPPNAAEALAMIEMSKEAPAYLSMGMLSKGNFMAAPRYKGQINPLMLAMATKG